MRNKLAKKNLPGKQLPGMAAEVVIKAIRESGVEGAADASAAWKKDMWPLPLASVCEAGRACLSRFGLPHAEEKLARVHSAGAVPITDWKFGDWQKMGASALKKRGGREELSLPPRSRLFQRAGRSRHEQKWGAQVFFAVLWMVPSLYMRDALLWTVSILYN